MKLGDTIDLAQKGAKVARKAWEGKGMFLMMIRPEDYSLKVQVVKNDIIPLTPWLGIKTSHGYFGPWLPSQEDIDADDWYEYGA